jgi:hypothetical protein
MKNSEFQKCLVAIHNLDMISPNLRSQGVEVRITLVMHMNTLLSKVHVAKLPIVCGMQSVGFVKN